MASNIPLTMRAIALAKFCKPSEYGLATLPVPRITNPDEVLIKVHAASINPVDVKLASEFVFLLLYPSPFTNPPSQLRQNDGSESVSSLISVLKVITD